MRCPYQGMLSSALSLCHFAECRDALLPLLIDQLSGQLDDNSSKPDHEASSQLLSSVLEVLDRKDVVSTSSQGCQFSSVLLRSHSKETSSTCAFLSQNCDIYRN